MVGPVIHLPADFTMRELSERFPMAEFLVTRLTDGSFRVMRRSGSAPAKVEVSHASSKSEGFL